MENYEFLQIRDCDFMLCEMFENNTEIFWNNYINIL